MTAIKFHIMLLNMHDTIEHQVIFGYVERNAFGK